MEITCFIHRFWVFSPRKYCFGSSFQIYGCLCGCSCWMLWERKKLWLCKISPAMASLLQSISITLILIPNRHAIPFIVLHGFPVFLFKESLLRSVEIMDLGVVLFGSLSWLLFWRLGLCPP
nr:unnamed protein product [Gossypium raimondii]